MAHVADESEDSGASSNKCKVFNGLKRNLDCGGIRMRYGLLTIVIPDGALSWNAAASVPVRWIRQELPPDSLLHGRSI